MSTAAILDTYTLRARVYPGLLVSAPAIVSYAGIFPGETTKLTAIFPVLLAAGVLYLLSQLVRQAGKAKEPKLWRNWGGKPTTIALRWRTAEPAAALALIRSRLERIAPDVSLPSREQERADPQGSDRLYEAAVSSLREATRSPERFPVVFAENVAYGFRRNTWAVRGLGAFVAAAALSACMYRLGTIPDTMFQANALLWAAFVVDGLLFMFWGMIATSTWVRQAADAYVDALFAAAAAIGER